MYAGSGKTVIGSIKIHNNVHSGKESSCQCRGHERYGFNPWVGKIPGEGNGSPLQCSCLENPMDRGAWRAAVHGDTKTRAILSD